MVVIIWKLLKSSGHVYCEREQGGLAVATATLTVEVAVTVAVAVTKLVAVEVVVTGEASSEHALVITSPGY